MSWHLALSSVYSLALVVFAACKDRFPMSARQPFVLLAAQFLLVLGVGAQTVVFEWGSPRALTQLRPALFVTFVVALFCGGPVRVALLCFVLDTRFGGCRPTNRQEQQQRQRAHALCAPGVWLLLLLLLLGVPFGLTVWDVVLAFDDDGGYQPVLMSNMVGPAVVLVTCIHVGATVVLLLLRRPAYSTWKRLLRLLHTHYQLSVAELICTPLLFAASAGLLLIWGGDETRDSSSLLLLFTALQLIAGVLVGMWTVIPLCICVRNYRQLRAMQRLASLDDVLASPNPVAFWAFFEFCKRTSCSLTSGSEHVSVAFAGKLRNVEGVQFVMSVPWFRSLCLTGNAGIRSSALPSLLVAHQVPEDQQERRRLSRPPPQDHHHHLLQCVETATALFVAFVAAEAPLHVNLGADTVAHTREALLNVRRRIGLPDTALDEQVQLPLRLPPAFDRRFAAARANEPPASFLALAVHLTEDDTARLRAQAAPIFDVAYRQTRQIVEAHSFRLWLLSEDFVCYRQQLEAALSSGGASVDASLQQTATTTAVSSPRNAFDAQNSPPIRGTMTEEGAEHAAPVPWCQLLQTLNTDVVLQTDGLLNEQQQQQPAVGRSSGPPTPSPLLLASAGSCEVVALPGSVNEC